MNRLTRVTAILIQLQSKPVITAKEIADRFEVSLRTVYRDVKMLQEAGIPVGSENGVGYFLPEDFRLAPIALTEEEANAFLISEELMKNQGDKSLAKNFESAAIKIKSTLKNFQKENIQILSQRTKSFIKDDKVESNALSLIQKAISDKIILEIKYLSLYKEEFTKRKIEPLAVYYTNNTWIAVAFCHLRKEKREFRLDRIQSIFTTEQNFSGHQNFNFQNYFEGS